MSTGAIAGPIGGGRSVRELVLDGTDNAAAVVVAAAALAAVVVAVVEQTAIGQNHSTRQNHTQ